MFRRIAHWLGLNQQKDEALAKRFAKMRQQYSAESADNGADILAVSRTGLNMRAVVGAEKTTGEQLRKNLLEAVAARAGEELKEPVGSK